MQSNLPPGVTQKSLDGETEEEEEIHRVTEAAIDAGHRGASTEWKAMALECVKIICLERQTFTMNDVRWMVSKSPIKTHDNRAMGGVIRVAQKLNWIEPTGQSIKSKVGHKSLLQIWKSKLYKSNATLFP